MPIDQVAELLDRWRATAGVFGRARMLREGMQLLGGLDAAERRMLARSLGEHDAPKLAERVEGRAGGALNADQLWSVVDGLLSMDDRQVDRVAASLRDPAERERLAREALTQGAASFDQGPRVGSGHRARLDELPPPGGRSSGRTEHVEVDTGGPELGSQDLGSQDLGSQDLGSQDLGTIELGDAGVIDVGIVDTGLHEPEAGPRSAPRAPDRAGEAGEADGPAGSGRLEVGRPDTDHDRSTASPPPHDDQEHTPPDEADHTPPHEADHTPPHEADPDPPEDADDAAALLVRLRGAETATARLRSLGKDALVRVDGATALAVLDALPDGWQRRRGALRLVDAGAFPTQQLAEALGRLTRTTDATFVAAALLAAGQVRAEQFDGILPERAVNRLTARSER